MNPDLAPSPAPVAANRRGVLSRLAGYLRSVLIMVLVTPVREGRLRNVGWPPGLQPVVWIAYGVAAACAGLVLFSGPIRSTWTLGQFEVGAAVPRSTVWMLMLVVDVILTLVALACVHGRAWLTALGLITVVVAISLSCLYALPFGLTNPTTLLVYLGLMVAVVVAGIVWHRRPLRWWEFPVVFCLLAAFSLTSLLQVGASAVPLGMDVAPNAVYAVITLLGLLCLPMGLAAGTAPAEIASATALRASSQLTRTFRPRIVGLALAAVIVVRLGQAGWEVTHLDLVSRGPQTMITTLIHALLMVAVATLVLGTGRHGPVVVPDVPPAGSGLGLPVGFLLLIMTVPIGIGIVLIVSITTLVPELASDSFNPDLGSSDLVLVASRTVMIVVLAIWCVRRLRRGDRASALVMGMSAVLLLGVPVGHLIGGVWPTQPDIGTLLLLQTLLVLGLVGWWALGRRLTLQRAESALALLLIAVLYEHRNLLDSPLEAVLEASSALILFGIGWTLFTGSDFANRGSRQLGIPTRVLLLLAYTLTVMAVLAFNSLARIDGLGGLDAFTELGDTLLGGALVVGTVAGLLAAALADRPARQDS